MALFQLLSSAAATAPTCVSDASVARDSSAPSKGCASSAALYIAALLVSKAASISADASETHVGAVLQQKTEVGIRPLFIYS